MTGFTAWSRNPTLSELLRAKMFWLVLILKIILGLLFASHYMRDLFVPFVNYFVTSGFANPWEYFFELGVKNSFPYPPLMLYILAVPRWLIGPLLSDGIYTVTIGHLVSMRLPLLIADVSILLVLVKWFPGRVQRVLWLYWASPIVIYVNYWHGQLDIIPTALFVWCLYVMRLRHFSIAMAIFALALATKSHLLVAVPFLLVFIYQEQRLRGTMRAVFTGASVYLLAVIPLLFSPAFKTMVYGTEEQYRLFAFQLSVGSPGPGILVAVLTIVLLWFRFAAYTRRNWDLFMLYLGILFAVFILLASPAPGYVLWSLPFIIHFMCRGSSANKLPYVGYATSYLTFYLMGSDSDVLDAWQVISPHVAGLKTPYEFLYPWFELGPMRIDDLTFTIMQGSLAAIIGYMYFIGVKSNEVYHARKIPTAIGLAGDSGSGKKEFSGLLARLLGEKRVTMIDGDDYHRWPRGHESWRIYTHLDVQASDLYQHHEDAIALSRGHAVLKGTYDHNTGQFTEEKLVEPSEYIIFRGLHSLSIDGSRDLYDLKLFMDPDEDLRRFWKVKRDTQERGYTSEEVLRSLDDRTSDRERYILSQREQADLVVRWTPLSPLDWALTDISPDLALTVQGLNTFNFTQLIRTMGTLSNLKVEHDPYTDIRWQSLHFTGSVSAAEIQTFSNELVPNLDEITLAPSFSGNLEGCLQLVFLICLSDKLRWSDKHDD